jgi:S-adenosylmethionine hydrolase
MGQPVPLSDLIYLPFPEPVQQANGMWQGEILHIDHFGNLVTTFRAPFPLQLGQIYVKSEQILGLSRTFSDVRPQELVAYLGSGNFLEIGVRDGSAAAKLDVRVGEPVFARETPPN